MQVLKITDQVSDKAVDLLKQYRLSHGLLIADALIAVTALEHGEPLSPKISATFVSSPVCIYCLTRSQLKFELGW